MSSSGLWQSLKNLLPGSRRHPLVLERIARLRADPALRKYADLMEQGGYWTDEMIALDQDPDHLFTCQHLQRVERAMRSGGIRFELLNGVNPSVDCQIDLDRFQSEFGHAAAALYQERHEIDRSIHDPKSALLWCGACDSRLVVVHPENAGPQTPRFPGTAPS